MDAPDESTMRLLLMFLWSDAWLLLSLIYARKPADSDLLRATGDFINHAIFTDEELDGGLGRLMGAGYAVKVGRQFAPSPGVLGWYDGITAGKTRTGVQKDIERVEKFLGIT